MTSPLHMSLSACTVAKVTPLWRHFCLMLLALFMPYAQAGTTELFNGVPIDFGETFLHEKRALQLHRVLSAQQTLWVRDAMARIAATVNEARSASHQESNSWRKNTSAQMIELRNALDASGVDPRLGLAVKQIHNWHVSASYIQFEVDYYMPSHVGQSPEIYRDSYSVSKTATDWHFSGHPTATPVGKLSCQFVNALWVCPASPLRP